MIEMKMISVHYYYTFIAINNSILHGRRYHFLWGSAVWNWMMLSIMLFLKMNFYVNVQKSLSNVPRACEIIAKKANWIKIWIRN